MRFPAEGLAGSGKRFELVLAEKGPGEPKDDLLLFKELANFDGLLAGEKGEPLPLLAGRAGLPLPDRGELV